MVTKGGTLLTDFEVAPHAAKDKVFSNTPSIDGSKSVSSSGCGFHFAQALQKDSMSFIVLVIIVRFFFQTINKTRFCMPKMRNID